MLCTLTSFAGWVLFSPKYNTLSKSFCSGFSVSFHTSESLEASLCHNHCVLILVPGLSGKRDVIWISVPLNLSFLSLKGRDTEGRAGFGVVVVGACSHRQHC